MGAEAGSRCLSPHPRGRCSCRSEARLFTHWTRDSGREGEAGTAVPPEWGRGWGVSYLPGAVQPVRDFQELSLCPGANVTAIPFQCNTVDHHETAERQEVKPWALALSAGTCALGPGSCTPQRRHPSPVALCLQVQTMLRGQDSISGSQIQDRKGFSTAN